MNKAHIVSMGSLLALVAMQKDVQAAMGCLFFDVSNLAWWCGEVKGNVYCENNVVDGFAETECIEFCRDTFGSDVHDWWCDDAPTEDYLGCACGPIT